MQPEYRIIFVIFLLLVYEALFTACSTKVADIENAHIAVDNMLIFEVGFSTGKISDAFIEYKVFRDTVKKYSVLSTAAKHHRIRIINLLADTTYLYRIITRTNGKIRQGVTHEFRTGKLPAALPAFNLVRDQYDFDGYILLKAYFNPGALIMMDHKANIVWYHLYDTAVVRPFEYTYDGNILSLSDSSIIEEFSQEGSLIRRIDTRNHGIQKLHHELFKRPPNQYMGLTYTEHGFDLSGRGGARIDTVHGDGMVLMDSTGKEVWSWDIFDHADPLADDSIFHLKHDWSHANSIALDPEGNYLVSMRNLSQVWKVDSRTGKVLWKLGPQGNFRLVETDWFLRQHDAHMDPEGHLMMFDNGNAKRGYSRVLALNLDEERFVATPVIEFRLDEEGTTYRMGSARMIDKEHILVCSPKKLLSLAVMNRQGEILWKVNGTKDSYKAFYIPRERIAYDKWF